MIYEMVTARLPFEAPTVMAMLSKHLLEDVVPPTQRRPDLGLSPAVDQLVAIAMAKDPAHRAATMDQFAEMISGVQASLPADPNRSSGMPIPSAQHGVAPGPMVTPAALSAFGPPQMPTPRSTWVAMRQRRRRDSRTHHRHRDRTCRRPVAAVRAAWLSTTDRPDRDDHRGESAKEQGAAVRDPRHRRARGRRHCRVAADQEGRQDNRHRGRADEGSRGDALVRVRRRIRHTRPIRTTTPILRILTNAILERRPIRGGADDPGTDSTLKAPPKAGAIGTAMMAIPKGAAIVPPPGFSKVQGDANTIAYVNTSRGLAIGMASLYAGTNDPDELAQKYVAETGVTFVQRTQGFSAGNTRQVLIFSSEVNGVAVLQTAVLYISPKYRLAVLYQAPVITWQDEAFQKEVDAFFINNIKLP